MHLPRTLYQFREKKTASPPVDEGTIHRSSASNRIVFGQIVHHKGPQIKLKINKIQYKNKMTHVDALGLQVAFS